MEKLPQNMSQQKLLNPQSSDAKSSHPANLPNQMSCNKVTPSSHQKGPF